MESREWAEHLSHWQLFLEELCELVSDKIGEKTKVLRQLRSIVTIRYGAVLNPNILLSFIPIITIEMHIKAKVIKIINIVLFFIITSK